MFKYMQCKENNAGGGLGYSKFYRGSGAGHWCTPGTWLQPQPFIVILEYPSKNTRIEMFKYMQCKEK